MTLPCASRCMAVAMLVASMLLVWPVSAAALGPGESLADPVLEARARALSRELRCVVCENETIDSSEAMIARDLRMLLRERLVMGESDQEILAHISARYGEFVLMRPQVTGGNWFLWFAGPVAFLLALGVACAGIMRHARLQNLPEPELDATETAQLERIMSDCKGSRENANQDTCR